MEKYIELAKKLKALSDRGVEGEKYNATAKLTVLMRKHGITMADIDGEERNDVYVRIEERTKKLWVQVASTILGGKFYLYKSRAKRGYYILEKVTAAERIEIEAKCAFYIKAFEKEVETLRLAFIMKNNLYPKDDDGTTSDKTRTDEELRMLVKAAQMAENIEISQFLKQLK